MTSSQYIIDSPLTEPVNFHLLKQKGLGYIKDLAGELWTNFNDSDPGITILDQLCYGLTELGYCTNFSIADILADQNDKIDYQGQFFSPEDILTTSPITVNDYRKVILDTVPSVKNLTITPITDTGGYQIWLYLDSQLFRQLQLIQRFTQDLIESDRVRNDGQTQSDVFYHKVYLILGQLQQFFEQQLDQKADSHIQQILTQLNDVFFENDDDSIDGNSDKDNDDLLDCEFNRQLNFIRKGIIQHQMILNDVQVCVNRQRNLAEFFYIPSILKPKEIHLKGQFTLKSTVVAKHVYQQITLALDEYAFGAAKHLGYQSLIDIDTATNDIFNGPKLTSGWILDSDLGEKRQQIKALELVKIIANIEGVISVENLLLRDTETQSTAGENGYHQGPITIKENEVAFFIFEGVLVQDQQVVDVSDAFQKKVAKNGAVQAVNLQALQQEQQNRPSNSYLDLSPVLPQGRSRNIAQYYSVQNTFPANYGIGEDQLPAAVGEQRLAQANQLKGYLLIFDQILANQFSQLANTAQLFSFAPVSTLAKAPAQYSGLPYQLFPSTYFYQPLYDIPNVGPLLKGHNSYNFGFDTVGSKAREARVWQTFKQDPFNQYIMGLRACVEDPQALDQRRNQMLDHLLARHGESGALYDEMITRTRWYGDQVKTQIIVKSLVLQNFQQLSYNRTKGYNCLQADKLATPGRYRLTNQAFEVLAQADFPTWLLTAIRSLIGRGVSHKKPWLTTLLQKVDDDGLAKQFSSVEKLASVKTLIKQLYLDDGNEAKSQKLYVNGQVDLTILAAKEALTKHDFSQFSTFELQANLLLGLVAHYELLIDILQALLRDNVFLTWLNSDDRTPPYEFDDGCQQCRVLRGSTTDTLYMVDQPLLTIVMPKGLAEPDTHDDTRQTLTHKQDHYQQHLDQLTWFAKQRKGLLLIERQFIDDRVINSQLINSNNTLANVLAKQEIDTKALLSCLFILPDYVQMFKPADKEVNDLCSPFELAWQTLITHYWPCHLQQQQHLLSFHQLQAVIPAFVDNHNQRIGQPMTAKAECGLTRGDS